MAMVTVKTSTGFECSYNDDVKKDWDFAMLCLDATDDNATDIERLKAFRQIADFDGFLPDKGQALRRHIRERNNGYVVVEEFIVLLNEILEASAAVKK